MIKLVQSPVVFDEEKHTYQLGDVMLQGITGMIHRQLFPDKYKDVPQFIMNRAADRGHNIHHDVELADATGIANSIEAKNYMMMRISAGYEAVKNEYTVSDEQHFASNIDCVWEKDGKISLADIKTTYGGLDKEYLSWQLSVYAYLFELQNIDLKVDKLFGVWIRDDKFELADIVRQSDEDVEELLLCEVEGRQFKPTAVEEKKKDIISAKAIQLLVDLNRQMVEAQEKAEAVKEQLHAAMNEFGVVSWDAGAFKATITKEGVRKTFDSKRFQGDHPDMYNEYIKESKTKESLKITFRDK